MRVEAQQLARFADDPDRGFTSELRYGRERIDVAQK
jgi:hypothetical protein